MEFLFFLTVSTVFLHKLTILVKTVSSVAYLLTGSPDITSRWLRVALNLPALMANPGCPRIIHRSKFILSRIVVCPRWCIPVHAVVSELTSWLFLSYYLAVWQPGWTLRFVKSQSSAKSRLIWWSNIRKRFIFKIFLNFQLSTDEKPYLLRHKLHNISHT